MQAGLGSRPDHEPVTASIGVAEIQQDALKDWKAQVELADQRMYEAKSTGRARCVGVNGGVTLWTAVSESA